MQWKNTREARGVAALGGSVVGDRPVGEEEREHRSDAVHRDARAAAGRADVAGALLELPVDFRVRFQMPQHGQSRRHGQRIARERAGLVDGPERRDFAS